MALITRGNNIRLLRGGRVQALIMPGKPREFTPDQLFLAMQGAWLEPTPGYIWQENTGVTPTTTGGQTIGKIADQSDGGHDATQATAGNRPLLGRRYNLLTYSEDFSNAAWNDFRNTSISSNAIVAPDGTATADTLIEDAFNASHYVQRNTAVTISAGTMYTFTLYVKPAGRNRVGISPDSQIGNLGAGFAIYDLSSGTVVDKYASSAVCSITSVGNNWWRISYTHIATGTTARPGIGLATANYSTTSSLETYLGDGTSGIYIWGADLRLTSDVGKGPAYQRITTATDYDYGQYPAAVHDTNDSLTVSLPDLGSGVFSSAGSVYFATPVGMSALHNQSMGTTYQLPALSSDIYSWIVVPQRLSVEDESNLAIYMASKAGI